MPQSQAPDYSVLYLRDESGELRGVQLSPALWEQLEPQARELLTPKEEPPRPEPLSDWQTLTQYWDFKYPVDYDVTCGECGQHTDNWQADEPRKFRLVSASLGGLVAFQCQQCQAKVIKRHFKDEVITETQPHRDKKDDRFIGIYGPGGSPGQR